MEKTDKIAIAIGLSASVLLLAYVFKSTDDPLADSKEPFRIVDSYYGCDIIRYTDESNRWHYFMKCNDAN
jgi:hypothetical protein